MMMFRLYSSIVAINLFVALYPSDLLSIHISKKNASLWFDSLWVGTACSVRYERH